MHTRFAIVGGGLSGLALADHLHRAGEDFQLFEARKRFGGRVLSCGYDGAGFDLGPSWYWPGQPRMAALAARLGLRTFDQHAHGALMFEAEDGKTLRNAGFSSMQGSLRIEGGMGAVIDGLVAQLPAERLHLDHAVRSVSQDGTLTMANGRTISADTIIVATPPRVASTLTFTPALESTVEAALTDIPTWMAGHAKFVAIYQTAFWRDAGLSGDAMSRRGPLVEIHDASSTDPSGPAALFGFVGVPATTRKGRSQDITNAALAQLANIFGEAAKNPVHVAYQDWAFDPNTATPHDLAPLTHHPHYAMPAALSDVWDGKLRFCATEVAPEMGGFLEGALAAAEMTAQTVLTKAVA